jgi:hypothetical protein
MKTGQFARGTGGGSAAVADEMVAGEATETATTETATTASTADDDDHEPESTGESERPMTIREAWAKAKAEHSAKEPAGPATTPTDEDDDTDDAATRAAATARGKTGVAEVETTDGLLTDAEYDALEAQHAGDPKAFRRALEGAYTQKTQALAAKRSTLERLQPYTELVDALEDDDPEVAATAVRQLAKELGVALSPGSDGTEVSATETAAATSEELLEKMKAKLGPELDYMAEALLPALQDVLKDLLVTELAPVRALTKKAQEREAKQQTDTVLSDFQKTHADWKDHEPAIVELMGRFEPTTGATEAEYLDALYTIATAPKTATAIKAQVEAGIAKGVKAHIEKINRGSTTAETRLESTADTQVTQRRPANATIQQAYEAAKQGIRWVDDD